MLLIKLRFLKLVNSFWSTTISFISHFISKEHDEVVDLGFCPGDSLFKSMQGYQVGASRDPNPSPRNWWTYSIEQKSNKGNWGMALFWTLFDLHELFWVIYTNLSVTFLIYTKYVSDYIYEDKYIKYFLLNKIIRETYPSFRKY